MSCQHVMKFENDIHSKCDVVLFKHKIPAGTIYPLHWHDFIEFEIILSGSAKHIYNNTEYTLHKGNAYLMCNYDLHEWVAITDIVLYSIHFDRKLIDEKLIHFLEYKKFHSHFDKAETSKIIQKIKELENEIKHDMPFQTIVIQNIINDIIISMLRKSSPKELQSAPLPVQLVTTYLNEHYSAPLTLEILAKECSFTPNYLGSLFKKQMGCSINEYLNLIRLKHACSLLRSTNLPIKEIASMTGYNSLEYFMYVFKQKMMSTPKEYRKLQKSAAALTNKNS